MVTIALKPITVLRDLMNMEMLNYFAILMYQSGSFESSSNRRKYLHRSVNFGEANIFWKLLRSFFWEKNWWVNLNICARK